MKNLIVTIGVPGAGKSTALKKLRPNAVVVSPDHISYDEHGHFSPARLSQAWKESYAKLFKLLSEGEEEVAFDATMLTPDVRGAVIAAGRHFGYFVISLFVKATLEEACERNANRREKDPVPLAVIARMHGELVPPLAYDPEEFDGSIITRGES